MSSTFTRLHPRLPIFGLHNSRRTGGGIVYSPGHVVRVNEGDWVELRRYFSQQDYQGDFLRGVGKSLSERLQKLTGEIVDLATEAKVRYEALATGEFAPECLTLYLSNHCNLGCHYCYAAEPGGARKGTNATEAGGMSLLPVLGAAPRQPILSEGTVLEAAQVVAGHCRVKKKPFQLVLHGGGEPTLHPALLKRVVEITQTAARQHEIPWFGYIATHGIMDSELATWLSKTFDRIGVSCDGPQDIHDAQRQRRSGDTNNGTFAAVSRTIHLLRAAGAAVTLRATITPRSVQRQAEIVQFFHREFDVDDIRFEPAYNPHGERADTFQPDDAPRFVSHFLSAQRVAAAMGCHLEVSGVRLDEIHGPFCNVFRNVLQLTPDGSASACFLCTDGRIPSDEPFVIGAPRTVGQFHINAERTWAIQELGVALPERCHDCVNIYHCARDCPEVCPVVEADSERVNAPGFRCRIQKQLSETWIRELGETAVANDDPENIPRQNQLTSSELSELVTLISDLPSEVDADAIVRQWQKSSRVVSKATQKLPPPTWAVRAYDDIGSEVWQNLRLANAAASVDAPLAAYVHIPFCDRKCAFCDCYAIYMPPDGRNGEQPLVDALLREIKAWVTLPQLCQRPLSTIHFGGGTANYLSAPQFEKIVHSLRSSFNTTEATEWAVETTSSQITSEHTEQLWNWGFRRLHVGVQCLDDSLRRVIGRKEDAVTVLRKLSMLLDRGFIVSVDLVYGLPGLTISQFARDIDALASLGIDGCSLYHLNASHRNAHFVAEHRLADRSPVSDFVYFHTGEQMLRARGFHKNHFAHFARPRDRNVYYTHVTRGEDLLALGPTADGFFGDYSYRHPHLAPYIQDGPLPSPPFEGGLREKPEEIRLRPASSMLMSGRFNPSHLDSQMAERLLEHWLDLEWLEGGEIEEHEYVLTAAGSWHLNTMLQQLSGNPR